MSVASDTLPTLTIAGFVGTVHSASPEQFEERAADTRSAIYSLCATLWFMLTAHTLFTGSLITVMHPQVARVPSVEQLTWVPDPVWAVLRCMLAKDPADRQQTAQQLRRGLEACRQVVPVESRASAVVVSQGFAARAAPSL